MSEKTTNVFSSISIYDEAEGTIEINSNGWVKVTPAQTEDPIMMALSTAQMKAIAKFLNAVSRGSLESISGDEGGAK